MIKKTYLILFSVLATLFLFSACSSSQTGTLVLKLTDAPTDLNIEKALVTISKIEVHKADSDDSNWIEVVSSEQTFDLMTLVNVTTALGEKELGIGKYTQVRLALTKAVVTIDGTEYPLTVPSESLKLTKGFDIVEGKSTTLTLDFDAKDSIKENGKGDYKLNPTIKILSE